MRNWYRPRILPRNILKSGKTAQSAGRSALYHVPILDTTPFLLKEVAEREPGTVAKAPFWEANALGSAAELAPLFFIHEAAHAPRVVVTFVFRLKVLFQHGKVFEILVYSCAVCCNAAHRDDGF